MKSTAYRVVLTWRCGRRAAGEAVAIRGSLAGPGSDGYFKTRFHVV